MPTELDGAFERYPYPVFKTVGDTALVMIADKKPAPDYEFGTKTQKVGKDGKPKTQDIVTGIVIDGTTAKVRDGDNGERDATPGEVVTVFLAGAAKFKFYEAKNKLGALRVSDVLAVRFDSTEDTGKGNPLKVFKVGLRRAKPEEASLADRAETLHQTLNGVVLEPAATAPVTSDDDFFG